MPGVVRAIVSGKMSYPHRLADLPVVQAKAQVLGSSEAATMVTVGITAWLFRKCGGWANENITKLGQKYGT